MSSSGIGVFLALIGVAAGCGSPPPADTIKTAPTSPPTSGGPNMTGAIAADPPAACPKGFGLQGSIEIHPGAPAFFYEDRPSLGLTSSGATYVYLDHNTAKSHIARLSADGTPQTLGSIKFPTADERSHIVGAARGRAVAVASAVYHAQNDADIELLMLDEQDRTKFSVRVDPSPLLDGTPALAWGDNEIAVAWLRGPYPTPTTVEVALIEPSSGKVRSRQSLTSSGSPGVPAIAWDGEAYWIAYQTDVMRQGINVARVNTPKGIIIAPRTIGKGANPALLPTPVGIALAYDDSEGARGIWFTILDRSGAISLPPARVATHPDPLGSPRKPVLAWDGARFAIAYETHFHASVMTAREPEANLLVVEPDGAATPPVRLHPDGDAGEMPAVIWAGAHWLTVFNQNRLQQGKTPTIVAARVACQSDPPAQAAAAPGPCDPRSKPAPDALLAAPQDTSLTALPLSDGGWAAVTIPLNKPDSLFVLADRDGKTIATAKLHTPPPVRNPTIARLPGKFAIAWSKDDAIEITLLAERGEVRANALLKRDPKSTGAPALAWTPAGLVAAWSDHTSITTALLSGDGRVLRSPSKILTPPFQPGSCALGHGPHGLLLAFTTGTEMSETSVVRVARLSDRGDAPGPLALASQPYAFLRNPTAIGTPSGFVIAATGPLEREVIAIELGPKGEIVKPERKLLSSYGFVATGAFIDSSGVRAFGLDGKNVVERLLCP